MLLAVAIVVLEMPVGLVLLIKPVETVKPVVPVEPVVPAKLVEPAKLVIAADPVVAAEPVGTGETAEVSVEVSSTVWFGVSSSTLSISKSKFPCDMNL